MHYVPESVMRANHDRLLVSLRRMTGSLAIGVAAFVPVMQVAFDRTWPKPTKPVLTGLVVAGLITSLCLLPRRWHLRLFFISVMLVLIIGSLELIGSIVLARDTSSIYEWDARCIYRLRPNAKKTFVRTSVNGGEKIPIFINSQGYRGPELNPDAATERILVYGDSFVEAEYTLHEQTFVARLRAELSIARKDKLELVNAGVIGYGPDQILKRMHDEIPCLSPAAVVVCCFADNDLGDLLRNKLYRLNAQSTLQENSWSLAPTTQYPGQRPRYEPTLWRLTRETIRGFQSRTSATESYIDRWLQLCQDEYDNYIVRQDDQIYELQVDHYDADVSLTPDSESSLYKRRLFQQILGQMQNLCASHSVPLLLVIIPSPGDLIPDYDFYGIDRARFPDYAPRAISDLMQSAAVESHTPCVNLFDTFAHEDARELYFRAGDNHWNDKGQSVAAKAVAPALKQLLDTGTKATGGKKP